MANPRFLITSLAVIGLAVAALFWPFAAHAAQPARMEQRKIAENVYVMQNPSGSSNAMFVVTDEGVVVWDGDIRTADEVSRMIKAGKTEAQVLADGGGVPGTEQRRFACR